MRTMRRPSGTTVIYVAYVFFLLGFVSLGLFVAALAFGSSLVVWAGIALVGNFTLAVAAFRAGSSRVEKHLGGRCGVRRSGSLPVHVQRWGADRPARR